MKAGLVDVVNNVHNNASGLYSKGRRARRRKSAWDTDHGETSDKPTKIRVPVLTGAFPIPILKNESINRTRN